MEVIRVKKAPPGEVFEAEMRAASSLSGAYDTTKQFEGIKPLKNQMEVTNVQFGRSIPTLRVEAPEEPVGYPKDMTRQIPRYNVGALSYSTNEPLKVARISQHTTHVPRRAPTVIHGVNSLNNSQANVIRGEAEFFGVQQGVKALKDTLNYDPLDQIKKDMLRISKADATDEITAKSGLHNTEVRRSRVRKRAGQIYV